MENKKSMINAAYELLRKSEKAMSFADLYNSLCCELNLSEDEKKRAISRFYTDISLDGRFVALKDKSWDLKERKKYEEIHQDTSDIYNDEDDSSSNDDEDDDDEEESLEVKSKKSNEDSDEQKSKFDDSTDEESEDDEKKPSYDM
jgi:DNA-directed RNA polymerase subunit delta